MFHIARACLVLVLLAVEARAQSFVYLLGNTFACQFPCSRAVQLVNAATGHTLATIDLPIGTSRYPTSLSLSSDGLRLFVTDYDFNLGGAGRLTVIDAITRGVIASVPVGHSPEDVEVLADGTRAYVVNRTDHSVSVVDLTSFTVIATVPVQRNPTRIVATPDGNAVYVANNADRSISKIATADNRVSATIAVGSDVAGIDISPDGSRLFVMTTNPHARVVVVDTALDAVLRMFGVDSSNGVIRDVSAQSASRLFASIYGDSGRPSRVLRIDATDGSVLGSLSLPGDLLRFARDAPGTVTYAVEQPFFNPGLKQLAADGSAATTIATGEWLSAAVVNDPCAFEATASPPAVGPAGGSGTLSLPAPAGCAWTIDPSAVRGLTIGGPLSGTGPATRTFTMTASALPRFGIIGVGRQALPIEQTVPRMHVEFAGGTSTVGQPFAITGWALDESAAPISAQDPGVDAVHVWAYPAGSAPVFVGAATTGISRADVANTFGNRYRLSGFQINVSNLPSGAYRLVFFAHSTRSNAFSNVQSVDAVVQQAPQRIVIDTPSASGTVSTPFRVSGWAVDPAAADRNGSGVAFVHVWAYPDGGGPPVFLGAAGAGLPRPDVAVFVGPSADRTGFDLPAAALTPGSYTLVVFAGSVAGPPSFSQAQRLTIAPSRPMMAVDQPRASTSVNANTQIAGWALDLSSSTGTGVDVVQAWAYPVSGGAAVFVGTATRESRPDVAAFVGTRFLDCGFRIDMRGLPAGSYDLAIFARSTVTATFNNVRIVRITVQ